MFELETCEGGTEGRQVWAVLSETATKFFSLDLGDIQVACNRRRELLLQEWQHKSLDSVMSEYGLPDVTYGKGIEEARPPFDLFHPLRISVCIWAQRQSCGNEGLAAMELEIVDKEGRYARLHVFLRTLDKVDRDFHWRGFCMPIEDILIHELLHACGDAPWRGRVDGIIRHNIIGIEAVKRLLRPR